ncbi:hypothetical protein T492DRAFT_831553 [Pavlovales sp. CCMP2436]|nr:hypothetical protein T492DRAFT_831553 [Pavlovales sp. CCMP2436]
MHTPRGAEPNPGSLASSYTYLIASRGAAFARRPVRCGNLHHSPPAGTHQYLQLVKLGAHGGSCRPEELNSAVHDGEAIALCGKDLSEAAGAKFRSCRRQVSTAWTTPASGQAPICTAAPLSMKATSLGTAPNGWDTPGKRKDGGGKLPGSSLVTRVQGAVKRPGSSCIKSGDLMGR